MATKTATKSSISKKQVIAHRTRAVKDNSPNWEGCETWSADAFNRYFVNAMAYYRLESEVKTFKPFVIKWMTEIGCAKEDIAAMKKIKDNRINTTMGAVASCLLRGMTPQRPDFNNGKDSSAWLRAEVVKVLAEGKDDVDPEVAAAEKEAAKKDVYTPSIQERLREVALNMTEEIENAYQVFNEDPENFDPKAFKVLSLLKSQQAKAAHARIIKEFYARDLAELEELASGNGCEQLKEGYSHLSKKQVRNFIAFLTEIQTACTMLMQEAKVNRAPRKTKAVSKDKIVAKLKYKKTDEPLKLVSVNPTDIIGAKELWVYNTKSRKIGKYVATEFADLAVKGTSIVNFDEVKSVMKTVRKPEEKLKEFKAAGKVQLRKFLDDINATEARMNGRINEDIVLLKASS
jgi:predicted lipid-binding transport protein (Tim44 family)